MKTIILTLEGGDTYNKNKQLDSIRQRESLSEIKEVQNLDSLEEELLKIKDEKVIILKESSDLVKFEYIVKTEFPELKERLEVIPELFVRSKLKENSNYDPNAVIFFAGEEGAAPIMRRVIPIYFPFTKDYFKIHAVPDKGSYLIITDISYGLWFPMLGSIAKYFEGGKEAFENTGQYNIPSWGTNVFRDNIVDQEKAKGQYVLSRLENVKQKAIPVYNLMKEIVSDVRRNTVKLDQDRVDSIVKKNDVITRIVESLIQNYEKSNTLSSDSSISGKNRGQQEQTLASKISQALGIDQDAEVAAANMRKAGLALVVDAADAIIKHAKEKKDSDEKEVSKGTDAQAFLSHSKAETLLSSLFEGYGNNYFVGL